MNIKISQLQIIYSALMAGLGLFALTCVFVAFNDNQSGQTTPLEDASQLLIIATFMAFSSVGAGLIIYTKQLEGVRSLEVQEKLIRFRTAMIVRAATMEGPGIFFTVVFLLTHDTKALVGSTIMLALMLFFFPSKNRINNDIGEFE